ncbi:MAG: hypothetical protein M3021_08400 [Actinomycetota bacterium]|nr:hypothetical protein [Actinomycetota bacterium]
MEGTIMYVPHQAPRWTGLALTLLVFAAVVPAPASAQLDPGTPAGPAPALVGPNCPLTRIGTQLVRCGDLTGAGVAAAIWIPES